jgi:L-lactate dehydrogenase
MKIALVGAGRVGAAVAFALTMREVADEVVLVGRGSDHTAAEAMDLRHASVALSRVPSVRAGGADEARGADLVVVCPSIKLPEPHQRFDFAVGNARLMEEILPPLVEGSPDAVLLVVTNPVDVMTWHALRITGLPPERVIGSGTWLDTLRVRSGLAQEMGIGPGEVDLLVLGDHGPTSFAAASIATAAGRAVDAEAAREAMRRAIREGRWVYERKGYTSHAVAAAVADIGEAVLRDTGRVLPVSSRIDGYLGVGDVCLSLPCSLGRGGIRQQMHPTLSGDEEEAFRRSAAAIREVIEMSSAGSGT